LDVLRGLALAAVVALAIACGVLGLSSLYVGRWSTATGLLAVALALGLVARSGWRSVMGRFAPPAPEAAATAVAVPAAPALLAGAWLVVLATVLAVGAWLEAGLSRWLSGGTATCLLVVGLVIIAVRRTR
jgi:hypothetical protein